MPALVPLAASMFEVSSARPGRAWSVFMLAVSSPETPMVPDCEASVSDCAESMVP
jgi:hypothetical protein